MRRQQQTPAERTAFFRGLVDDMGVPFRGEAIFMPGIQELSATTGYSTGFFYHGGFYDKFEKNTGLTVVHKGGFVMAGHNSSNEVSLRQTLIVSQNQLKG